MNEVLLIKEIQAGNKAAFSELVSAYRNKVLNTCNRFLIDKQDAEDASQEVFIEVFRSIHSFRSESKLSTWIYRIAVTKSLDALKKRKRKHFWRSVSTVPQENRNARTVDSAMVAKLGRIILFLHERLWSLYCGCCSCRKKARPNGTESTKSLGFLGA